MKGHKENLYVDMKALKINNTTHTVTSQLVHLQVVQVQALAGYIVLRSWQNSHGASLYQSV